MSTDSPINYVETTLPIPIETLKRQFTEENVVFVADYTNSKISGQVFLTYLSNLDIPCQVRLDDVEAGLELLSAYLSSPTLVRLPELEEVAINVLLEAKGIDNDLTFDAKEFIEGHQEQIELWLSRLESLTLYMLYCVQQDHFQEHVKQYPEDSTTSMVGCNFINLIGHDLLPILVAEPEESRLRYYSAYFNEYIFKGNNLFHYWAVENNPLFVLSQSMVAGTFDSDEFKAALDQDIAAVREELSQQP